MGQLLGYARVSTQDQNLDLQVDALSKAGCDRVWMEKSTGRKMDRPELTKLRDYARAGDTVVVWKLDRLGRGAVDLVKLLDEFKQAGIQFRSLTEGIDTSSPLGEAFFLMVAAIASCEVSAMRERTLAGMAAAKQRGRYAGRPPTVSESQISHMKQMYRDGTRVAEIAQIMIIGCCA